MLPMFLVYPTLRTLDKCDMVMCVCVVLSTMRLLLLTGDLGAIVLKI